eukprot:TRINITY_DN1438_c0_g1_i1.p1 TRINITY_DN1438_c0_g1~~TRINITY_DN1438_c0_g1_i1.p1  ORF type:complete len:325 (+),score=83.87 TRINITY_DN1438_c0_g1_i1:42-977(+)
MGIKDLYIPLEMYKILKEIPLNDCITSVAFSGRGDYLAAGTLDERVTLWDTKSLAEKDSVKSAEFDGHKLGVIDVRFNPSGSRLAVASMDSVVKIWNVDEGGLMSEIGCNPFEAWRLEFTSNGREIFVTGDGGKIVKYDIETKESLETLKTVDAFNSAIALSRNGRWLATANNLGLVFLFNLEDREHPGTPIKHEVHSKMIRSLCFTADAKRLIIVSDDQHISLLDIASNKPVQSLTGHKGNINSVDIHPTENKFITASFDQTIRVWDIDSKQSIHTIPCSDNIWSAKYSNDGRTIAAGAENGILSLYSQK